MVSNGTSLVAVTAIHAPRPQGTTALSARHGASIRAFTNLKETLRKSVVHAVSICSYSSQYASHFMAAARAGKHVILEGLICRSLEEARQMEAAAEQTGVKT